MKSIRLSHDLDAYREHYSHDLYPTKFKFAGSVLDDNGYSWKADSACLVEGEQDMSDIIVISRKQNLPEVQIDGKKGLR